MEYKTRNDFGKLFNEVYELGVGAEIGVQHGRNARCIGEHWSGKILCVDNWNEESESLAEARATLIPPKYVIFHRNSIDAAKSVPDWSLDWVYIDAGHTYEEVKSDFEAWFPKVRKGGVISGHDYGINNCIGVKEFIDEYMTLHPDVKMNFTTEDWWRGVEYQSWWFVKQ